MYLWGYPGNRCRVQTRQKNDQDAALLAQHALPAGACAPDWVQELNAENEDPIRDSWFPKVLFVTPPKCYEGRRKSARQEHRASLNLEVSGLV